MELLDWRNAGRQKDHILLTADLNRGWKHLEKRGRKPAYWGFDEQIWVPNKNEPDYWCHLYFVALGPVTWESVRTFPGTVGRYDLGHNSVSVNGSRMEVDIPLSNNAWGLTQESNRLRIHVQKEPLFSIATPDGVIGFRVQLWFVHHGPRSMFVKHQYEWGDGLAWIGGRPESNRRKF